MKQYYFVGISEWMLWIKKVNSCFWFHFHRWLSVAVYWSQACNINGFQSLICPMLEFHGRCWHANDDEDKQPSNHQVAINSTFACNVSIQKYDMCHNACQLSGSQYCVRMFCRFQSNNNQRTDCKHTLYYELLIYRSYILYDCADSTLITMIKQRSDMGWLLWVIRRTMTAT